MSALKDLIEISNYLGTNKHLVIAQSGCSSYKDEKSIWIKARCKSLASITEHDFAVLDREKINAISTKKYSDSIDSCDTELKIDLFRSSFYPELNIHPSIETPIHNLINYKFVVHLHPNVVNGLLCSVNAKKNIADIFGAEVLFVEYAQNGFSLFKKIENELVRFRKEKNKEPQIIFIQNNGLIVASNSISEIKTITQELIAKISNKIKPVLDTNSLPVDNTISKILPAIRMILSENSEAKIASIRRNSLIDYFIQSTDFAKKVLSPLTPEQVRYCNAHALYIDKTTPEEIIAEFENQFKSNKQKTGNTPKIVLIKGYGLVAVEKNIQKISVLLDVFEDAMKISLIAENFGGQHFLGEQQVSFMGNCKMHSAHHHSMCCNNTKGRVENKIIIITGGAQGFGGGIAEQLFAQQANIVIADLNDQKGQELADQLNAKGCANKAICVKTDVSKEESIKELIAETVKVFGGLDVFISNAGILRAGGLEEMTLDSFELMTKINYTAYFLCSKYASEVMKLQSKYHASQFTDIIQINSKSGLKGSNKNFAYAGGKFGGIGLTQSFAMELMPFKIKVNSICPGNLLDGPLWSDPEKGLFVQYLKAGKVPGAKSVEDVKKFYEGQVPAKRGCQIEDVVRAILYVIEQEYETGQAIPVTGGQEMLK